MDKIAVRKFVMIFKKDHLEESDRIDGLASVGQGILILERIDDKRKIDVVKLPPEIVLRNDQSHHPC